MTSIRSLRKQKVPRVLVVTPEITYLPQGMGNMANSLKAKAGGLADVSASLVSALFELGADVHVALPNYRRMFSIYVERLISDELRIYKSRISDSRIHLAEDRIFYYRNEVYSAYKDQNPKISLAFQREVINNILLDVQPDLIHCNDWMTGLIPAAARRLNIPCLFTLHNIHTQKMTMETIEDSGIDAAEFWPHLYFEETPRNYEAARSTMPVDLLASGIFSAHYINTVSPKFLDEVCNGWHGFIQDHIRQQIINKRDAGCAQGILNSPDPSFDPSTDDALKCGFNADTHRSGKREIKRELQAVLGLAQDENAPLFFWPSRLDPVQKGCQLLANILYDVISAYWEDDLQVVMVANGSFQDHFKDIVRSHDFYNRVAVCDFDETLSRQAYAASDFMLMPSLFEPCGLPQMISCIYGSLPVVHDTGGLHDTVTKLDVSANQGNGFSFDVYDENGLRWAIDQAMQFYHLPSEEKETQIARIMKQSMATFNHSVTAKKYFDIYEKMLSRPLISAF